MSKKNQASKEELRRLLSHKKGKQYYADYLGVSIARIEELLEEIRDEDRGQMIEDEKEGIVLEKFNEEGDREVQYLSERPLNKEEIEELYGIDNITTRLSTYWNKQTSSGKYLVSALIKCTVQNFYTLEQLEDKLAEIFPPLKAVSVIKPNTVDRKEQALFIYISDDHCGMEIKNSIYDKQYSGEEYEKRLMKLISHIKAWGDAFEHVFVINLGDEVDGWNGKTTRLDHDLDGSLSNKEQFDCYTRGRKKFYDELFGSGLASGYTVLSLNNSNHSGRGLSYIINKAMEFYIQGRYPNVKMISQERFIDFIEWGDHIIGLTHGKDEKLMKSPLPLNLDAKTDLWLFEYYDKLGFSPNDFFISTIKGDIHKYNVNSGKSGRYVNCPSIAGGSGWIELNFGDTRAGALLEIVGKSSPNIISIPVWFN